MTRAIGSAHRWGEGAVSDGTQLGALLVESGLITNDQLAAALDVQAQSGRPIGRVLIDQGLISESDLVRALAKQVGLEFIDLTEHPIDATIASLIPEGLARRYQALPDRKSTRLNSSHT